MVVDLAKNPVNYFHKYACVIVNIKELLSRDWEVMVRHTLREGNMCADSLVKLGLRGNKSIMYWDSPPKQCVTC